MRRPSDKQVEILIGKVLRGGVLLACSVTFIGLGLYLVHNATVTPRYQVFHSVNAPLRSVYQLVPNAFHGSPLAIIQLGVLLLIADSRRPRSISCGRVRAGTRSNVCRGERIRC